MKVGTGRPLGEPAAVGGSGARRAEPRKLAAASRTGDSATIMGIPEPELTPKVRDAIMRLMREVEGLRRDLARAQSRLADLERLADQDALLPLPNRRAFVREISRAISYSQRYRAPASLLYFDINNFKTINDTLGHAAGDEALKIVAETLTHGVRESDVVGRIGGDEFGVILVRTEERFAEDKAQALADSIRGKPLLWQGQEIPIEVACGVYAFQPGEDAGAALAAADRAMYRNKAALKDTD